MAERPLSGGSGHLEAFDRLRRALGDRRRSVRRGGAGVDPALEPFAPGRDPRAAGRALEELARARGWSGTIARSTVFVAWTDAVGEDTAKHATPTSLTEGTLTVRCDSTAWATQLGLMRSRILAELAERFPDAGITAIRFIGPDAPSWKRGPRSVPGRGPRDTYG